MFLSPIVESLAGGGVEHLEIEPVVVEDDAFGVRRPDGMKVVGGFLERAQIF